MEFALLKNTDSNAVPFYGQDRISIVSGEIGSWKCVKEIDFKPYDLRGVDGLPEIHRRMRLLIEELGDCRIFIVHEIKGIPFAILDSAGFSIWKMEGEPTELFDHVAKTIKERADSAISCRCGRQQKKDIPQPVKETDNGEYFLDLKRILDESDSLNSKEILIPFLEKRKFSKLVIRCEHTPRWLEKDHGLFNLLLKETVLDGGDIVAIIRPDPDGGQSPRIPYPVGGCGGSRGSSCFEG